MKPIRQMFAVAAIVMAVVRPAAAQDDPGALAAVRVWVDAVMTGKASEIDAVLAPEFQIVRSDGSAHERADYIAGGFAKVTDLIELDDVKATRGGDIMVVRYVLVISGSVDGKALKARAPRLTVFRKSGSKWLVSAHANFAGNATK